MKLNTPLKYCAVVLAVAAPVATGWAVTAGASIGGDQGIEGSSHMVDVFDADGYEIERESIDGVVTVTITDSDGNVVALHDAPTGVAQAVENWVAPSPPVDVDLGDADSDACYAGDTDADDGWVSVSSDGDRTVAAQQIDGVFEARFFDDINAEELDARLLAGELLADIEGGQEIGRC